ncbi:hypothetical protein AB5I41_09080 [Sphingomonas sp. MMS24-JH45]
MMDARTYTAWMRAGMDARLLGAEAGAVIALRLTRLANGKAWSAAARRS